MAAKKTGKKKVFRASKAVKEAARNVIGTPRATVRETPKTKKPQQRHKRTLSDLLNTDDE
jgi:hypothetical protein